MKNNIYLCVNTWDGERSPRIMVDESEKWIVDRYIENFKNPADKLVIYKITDEDSKIKEMISFPLKEKYFKESYFKKHGKIYFDGRKVI